METGSDDSDDDDDTQKTLRASRLAQAGVVSPRMHVQSLESDDPTSPTSLLSPISSRTSLEDLSQIKLMVVWSKTLKVPCSIEWGADKLDANNVSLARVLPQRQMEATRLRLPPEAPGGKSQTIGC